MRSIGFGATIEKRQSRRAGELLKELTNEDLLKYGMIPEFNGRLPVVAKLQELDKDELVQILTVPRNALIKQYQKLFRMDGVELKFTDEAMQAVAQEALSRKTGARGLRSILEGAMIDIMYDTPSDAQIKEVIINEDVIFRKAEPVIVHAKESESA